MITNTISFADTMYKCNKAIMRYLVYECKLPIMSIDDTSYYFSKTAELKSALGSMPLYLKIIAGRIK